MSTVIAENYNLIMSQYKKLMANSKLLIAQNNIYQQNKINTATNINVLNSNTDKGNATNTTTNQKDFGTTLESISQKTEINYSNGNKPTYNGVVHALSNKKVQQTIKDNNIEEIVSLASQKYDIPENLIYKVIETESYFNPNCTSSAGAMGLMQLMPDTCKDEGVTSPYDPYQNIMAGTSQLRKHLNAFNGNLKLALAAYNAGPGNVRKYNGVPPFKETQNYIKKILGS